MATATKTKTTKKDSAKVTDKDTAKKATDRYFEGIGRRKRAVARVKLFTKGERTVTVNEKPLDEYFDTPASRLAASAALTKMNVEDKFRVVVKVGGSGKSAQADAVRLGTARALRVFNPEFRRRLKKAGFLTRDARKVERKKPGLKKARRAPQWSKR